jgi:TetR/AcrR family fatty acid metabolism transcriptional regulator
VCPKGVRISEGQRTFIDQARRAQIVAAAIDTIAEVGMADASLARIAARASTSKGVIAYHFAGKDELLREIVAQVLRRAFEYMGPRIQAAPAGPERLRAYIESNLGFMRDNRNLMIALFQILSGARDEKGRPRFGFAGGPDAFVAPLEELLQHLQESGELRADMDAPVVAMITRAAIDSVPARLARDPSFDVDRYAAGLTFLLRLATVPESVE